MQKPDDDSATEANVDVGAGCLDEQEIVDFAAGLLPAEKIPPVEAHLSGCDRCMALIATAAPHVASIQVTSSAQVTRPLENEPFAAQPTTPDGGHVHGRERPQLAPGTSLDSTYQVVRFLGRGGMGDVYEVKHARLAGRYAAKLLSSDLADNAQAFSRFQREALIASGLSHPNIVNVIDFCHLGDGRPCLVMEFLDGVDLAQVMAHGPLSPARTLRLVRQIASALTTLHGLQIIHRDLKPQNIFVLPEKDGEPERVKLVDFGLAKRSNPSMVVTHDRTLLGTPQYMAPEQAIGSADSLGAEADQFSLAAIVYEMLGGRHPFGGDVLSTVLYRIVHEPPAPLAHLAPHVPPHVIAAIERGLSKERQARFPSVKAFLQALEGEGTAMTPAPTPGQKKQRRSWFIRREVLASAGVLAVAMGIVAVVRTRKPPPEPAVWRATAPDPGTAGQTTRAATPATLPSSGTTKLTIERAPASPATGAERAAIDTRPAPAGAHAVAPATSGKPGEAPHGTRREAGKTGAARGDAARGMARGGSNAPAGGAPQPLAPLAPPTSPVASPETSPPTSPPGVVATPPPPPKRPLLIDHL